MAARPRAGVVGCATPLPYRSMTMINRNRRDFLADVGKGMLIAGVGATVAGELGLAKTFAADGADKRLTFGDREPLVSLLQDTPAAKLLPILATKVKEGTSL